MKQIYIELANEAKFKKSQSNWLNKFFPVWDTDNYHIEISGKSTEEQVGSLLRTLTLETLTSKRYNSEKRLFEDLIKAMLDSEAYISGGLCFTGEDGTKIPTGCCCGIEDWQAIKSCLIQGHSPWMGHDPYTNLKVKDRVWFITTESDLDPLPEDYTYEEYYSSIPFEEVEFKKLLVWLDVEFYDFVNGPLRNYLEKYHPNYATRFCQAFEYRFSGLKDML